MFCLICVNQITSPHLNCSGTVGKFSCYLYPKPICIVRDYWL